MIESRRIKYVAPSVEYWDVPGVDYNGELATYRVFGQMTPSMTQDKLAELYEREKLNGNPYPMDSVLHFAIFNQAYKLRNESPQEAEKLRSFLQQGLRRYTNTLTRVICSPFESDEIIHNYNTSYVYSLKENVIGPDGLITDIPDKEVLSSLLGTQKVDEINKVFQWINGTNSYIWRLNSKPEQRNERVVGFDASSDRFDLGCSGNPLSGYPAFLVLDVD